MIRLKGEMVMLEWKEEYSVGVSLIDTQHQHLFEIGNRAFEMLNKELDVKQYDEVAQIIDDLRQYTKYHFQCEEEYMLEIQYRQLFGQKVMHADFIEKLEEFDTKQFQGEEAKNKVGELLSFLFDWLINHIVKKDKLIGEEVRTSV